MVLFFLFFHEIESVHSVNLEHFIDSIESQYLLTYFHLMNIRSSGTGAPPLHGITMVSPYKAVTFSVPHTATQKVTDCYYYQKHTVLSQDSLKSATILTT